MCLPHSIVACMYRQYTNCSYYFYSQGYTVNPIAPPPYTPTEFDLVDQLPIDEWELSPDVVVLKEQLGSGNFGEVFKAIVTRTSAGPTLVAVKVLKST